uniref:Putative ovule protein n=1 Tax=Solanum chacoense TaxID=4108 RepID=A0A0V0GSI0_SOLCH
MEITKAKIQHTLREGNNLADFVANIVIRVVGVVQFYTSISLPTKGRCILNMDKAQVPSLRIRTRSINKQQSIQRCKRGHSFKD